MRTMETLKTEFTQWMSITNAEFRMHWRRRPMLVISLAMGFVTLASILISAAGIGDFDVLAGKQDELTKLITFTTWSPIGVILAMIFPVMMSDVVAVDHHIKMDEMLNSYPLKPRVYLAGKVAGVWVAAILPILVMAIFTAVLWWVLVGAFDLAKYMQLWLVGAIPLIVLNGGLVVLLCASQPTRVRAAVLAIGVICISFTLGYYNNTIWDYLNPLHMVIVQYFFAEGGVGAMEKVEPAKLALTIAVGVLEVFAVWVAMSVWFSRRQSA